MSPDKNKNETGYEATKYYFGAKNGFTADRNVTNIMIEPPVIQGNLSPAHRA